MKNDRLSGEQDEQLAYLDSVIAERNKLLQERDELRKRNSNLQGVVAIRERQRNEAQTQRDELLAALKEAKSLIQGYRAGGDKDVTKRVLAPINTAIAHATEGGTNEQA